MKENYKKKAARSRLNNYFKRMKKNRELYFFLILPITYLLIFKYWPLWGTQIAFKDFNPALGILGSDFVGLKHFEKFLNSYQFIRVLKNTLLLSLYLILAGFPIPIILALLLNCIRSQRYKKTVQNILYVPNFISVVVIVGMLMQFINPVVGIYGKVYFNIFGKMAPDLMASPKAFPHLYVWSSIWQTMGWSSIIYFAALSSIDVSQHEAAVIDGAGRFKRILYVDIPAILPTIVIMLILRCGRVMSIGFEKVYLMQTDLNLRSSEIISTYVYKVGIAAAGGGTKFSYATSIGLFNSLVNLIIIIIVNAISKKITETSLW